MISGWGAVSLSFSFPFIEYSAHNLEIKCEELAGEKVSAWLFSVCFLCQNESHLGLHKMLVPATISSAARAPARGWGLALKESSA